MLVVEFRPRPIGLQAVMLVGAEQAVEVEARCPLVISLALPPLGIVYGYGEPTPLISVGGRRKKVVEGGRG